MNKIENNHLQNRHKKINEDRLTYVMTCLFGNEVNVHMKDGNEIKGLFHGYNCNSDNSNSNNREGDISLNYAQVLAKNDKLSGPINKAMIIPENAYTTIIAKNINLELKDPDEVKNVKDNFKIDADISLKKKKPHSANRELKRWVCDDNNIDDPNFAKLKLDDKLNEPWDQFEQNRKLYGVTTTYKEEIYTTNLDINKVPHHVKLQADKIAKELENRGVHLDPEDIDKNNKDIDEEDLFGAVRRNKDKFAKSHKFKKDDNNSNNNNNNNNGSNNNKNKSRFHQFTIKDLKEKLQLVKKENEKKYPINKQKKINFTISSSNEENNSSNKKNKGSSKNPATQNAEFIGINALNLEPALPKLDEKTRPEWIMLKNKTKNRASNKKDKSTEKLEFITAAKEFNEKLANKINLNAKESNTKTNKNFMGSPSRLSNDNQKNLSNTSDKGKYKNAQDMDMSKIQGNGTMINHMNFNPNLNANYIPNGSNMPPYNPYIMNYNNMKNNIPDPNMGYYQNVMPDPQNNKMFQFDDLNMNRNDGITHAYQNININMMLNKFQNSMYNPPIKDDADLKSSTKLCTFPVKSIETNKSFDTVLNNALKYSKEEDCQNTPLEFKSTKNLSYKSILGEIPSCSSSNNYQDVKNFSNNMPIQQNISNIVVNLPFIPVVPRAMNTPFIEGGSYFNPYVRGYYPNNCVPINSNNGQFFNMPITNMDTNYSGNKNMNMYPLRNPHLSNNRMHYPGLSYMPYNMNYGVNNNITNTNNNLNMMNNSNAPMHNINMPPYPPDFVVMDPQKYSNPHSPSAPFFPKYQCQIYYVPPVHRMNNA
ncbi:ataxin-2 like protein, putative [Plasmodium vinckei petteri]|uniref:Ataxin-2 like protein, putative n=1 Tax=Plasmodium vinckei petteri TaxID=138298 RepID=A0A6V7STA8_PLAVN|nr:ataxin-2 like protein, putative [Plasmodium vinckei petteri]